MVDYMMAVAMTQCFDNGRREARRRHWSLVEGDNGRRAAKRSRWRVFLPELIR